jgi:hypothetical protein
MLFRFAISAGCTGHTLAELQTWWAMKGDFVILPLAKIQPSAQLGNPSSVRSSDPDRLDHPD